MTRHYPHISSSSSGFGLGLLAAATGAAITYFLYGTEKGAGRREKIKEYAHVAKEKVMHSSDDISDAVKEFYMDVKSTFKDRYEEIKNLDKEELKLLRERMKLHWEEIKDDVEETLMKARNKEV
jgi:gas vesicle protein